MSSRMVPCLLFFVRCSSSRCATPRVGATRWAAQGEAPPRPYNGNKILVSPRITAYAFSETALRKCGLLYRDQGGGLRGVGIEDPKAVALFQEVSARTEKGRIPWEPTATENEYVAPIGGKFTFVLRSYAVPVFPAATLQLSPPSLILKDAEHREVLRVSESIEGVTALQLNLLFEHAKRQALRVDDKVDEILTELKRDFSEALRPVPKYAAKIPHLFRWQPSQLT